MAKLKSGKCPACGGVMFKLGGRASVLSHDRCLKCRMADVEPDDRLPGEDGDNAWYHDPDMGARG